MFIFSHVIANNLNLVSNERKLTNSPCKSFECRIKFLFIAQGGKYANGIIAAEYKEGDTIDITLEITTNHDGWHEFRMCVWNDIKT